MSNASSGNDLDLLRDAGQRMANMLYNMVQRVGRTLTEQDANNLRALYEKWDTAAARRASPQPEAVGERAKDCLQDVVSHHGDFHMACTVTRDLHLRNGDRDSASYWDKQLHVLARMKVQAEAMLGGQAPSVPDHYRKVLAMPDGPDVVGPAPSAQVADARLAALEEANEQVVEAQRARKDLCARLGIADDHAGDECRMCNGTGIVGFPPDQYEDCPDCIAARATQPPSAQQSDNAAAANSAGLCANVTTYQFLTDVVTATGLLSHGRTDKGLARRISDRAFELQAALFDTRAAATSAAGQAPQCPKCMGFGWQPGVNGREQCGYCQGAAGQDGAA